uniref:uncharacterized protein LOC118150274 isoform X7 n=1 Tax=Callithrix jacchus TaxID=9483 RepID=UPI0023DD49B6|nr:uncharacterized protein LOC118150274 isoform X7 [Callithrix jacchus]
MTFLLSCILHFLWIFSKILPYFTVHEFRSVFTLLSFQLLLSLLSYVIYRRKPTREDNLRDVESLWSLLESAVPVVPSGSFLEACLSEPRATQVGHLIDFHISTQKRKNGKWDFVKHRYDKWSRFPRLTQVLEVPCGCGCGGMATRKLWILRKSGKETLTIQQFRESLYSALDYALSAPSYAFEPQH